MSVEELFLNSQDPDSPNELWRLAEQLTITQASVLLCGREPARFPFPEQMHPNQTPAGYNAVRQGLISACRLRTITCNIKEYETDDGFAVDTIDPATTTVDVDSLISWLRSRGHTTGFFFAGAGSVQPYLASEHPRYAPKLAAIVKAWLAVELDHSNRTPKQKLMKWLRENAAQFGLSDQDGKPMDGPIEEVAKVANWMPQGGAPKAIELAPPLPKPTAPRVTTLAALPHRKRSFAADLEDDIPF